MKRLSTTLHLLLVKHLNLKIFVVGGDAGKTGDTMTKKEEQILTLSLSLNLRSWFLIKISL